MDMDTLKTIHERFSCRSFTDEKVTDEQLDVIVKAGLAAPTGRNIQPFKIIVIKDKEMIDRMDDAALSVLAAAEDKSAYERILSRGGKVYYNAPAMIVITIDRTRSEYAYMDSGIVVENMALAATALGLGNVICAMAKLALMSGQGDAFKSAIGIDEQNEFAVSLLAGHAKTVAAPHPIDTDKVKVIS